MQTSEEPGRLCHKENIANSLLIIQTSGLASPSSWGFKQEAQPKMLTQGGRKVPSRAGGTCQPSLGHWLHVVHWALQPQRTGDCSDVASPQITHFKTQPQ